MKQKSTDELNHEIKAATNIEDYLIKNKENMLTSNLPEYLNKLLTQKGLKKSRCDTKFTTRPGICVPDLFR